MPSEKNVETHSMACLACGGEGGAHRSYCTKLNRVLCEKIVELERTVEDLRREREELRFTIAALTNSPSHGGHPEVEMMRVKAALADEVARRVPGMNEYDDWLTRYAALGEQGRGEGG